MPTSETVSAVNQLNLYVLLNPQVLSSFSALLIVGSCEDALMHALTSDLGGDKVKAASQVVSQTATNTKHATSAVSHAHS